MMLLIVSPPLTMWLQQHLPFTVLKLQAMNSIIIEIMELQQHLPFTVLKQNFSALRILSSTTLQQHLPFTVLKRVKIFPKFCSGFPVATTPTVYGIETLLSDKVWQRYRYCCNNTYRLRY